VENKEKYSPSTIASLRIVEETMDALLPFSQHSDLLPDLVVGLHKALQRYISQTKSECGSKNNYLDGFVLRNQKFLW
jgi:hypothetical protein